MQAAATKAGTDPADIGYMPFPVQKGGHFCSVVAADYLQAININSKHQEAARAWLDWFADKSGYARPRVTADAEGRAVPRRLEAVPGSGRPVRRASTGQDGNREQRSTTKPRSA